MKFRVRMKDPDTLHDAISDAVRSQVAASGITDEDELEALTELRAEKVSSLAGRWFEYGEYLEVEIDTDAETCVVVPARE